MLLVRYFLYVKQRIDALLNRQAILDSALANGDPLPENLTSFRTEYRSTMTQARASAEKRLGANLKEKSKGHTTCWALMKKLRNPTHAVAIDSETLLNHFTNIFYDPSEPLFFDLSALGVFPPSNFSTTPFTDAELVLALNDLNSQAATGPQKVASRYLKSVFKNAKTRVVLLVLMNRCFFDGVVPRRWGESEVFVLYKGKGDITDPVNYRGINLNDDFLRIYERLLDRRMMTWIRMNRPWGNQQFGFTEGVGTEDAFLCLESLASICTNLHRVPLYANFIDLQRAFPSMLRSRALQTLHEAGLPFELTRAFASTFSGNTCRLKINNKLTRVFFVNRGTKEGGINSPRIFNTVYAQVLKRLSISSFPLDVSEFDLNAVYYLVFADDLVLLSANLTKLESATNDLDSALSDLGMKINGGKTKWMSYLPRVPRLSLELPTRLRINYQGLPLENVDDFKYLGFTTTFDLSHSTHIKNRVILLNLAAKLTGRLLRSLETTNIRSLRAYYYSLVNSQLYSLSMIAFEEIDYDRAVKLYLQECFNLPHSYPMIIAKFFLGVQELPYQVFNARTGFVSRALRGSNSMASLAALTLDREFLLPRNFGWNLGFIRQFEHLIDLRDLDLSDPRMIEEAREELSRALDTRRRIRFQNSSSSFIIDLFPSLRLPRELGEHLRILPFESVRIVLIFLANMLQYTYFRSLSLVCPFCALNFSSTHIFDCRGISPNPICNWQDFRNEFHSEDFPAAIDRLFLVLQRWVTLTNRFQPSFSAHLEEYFIFRQPPPGLAPYIPLTSV
jgi:hypothetical protein